MATSAAPDYLGAIAPPGNLGASLVEHLCALNAAPSLLSALSVAISAATVLAGAERGVLLLANDDRTELTVRATCGFPRESVPPASVALDKDLALALGQDGRLPPALTVTSESALTRCAIRYFGSTLPVSCVTLRAHGLLVGVVLLAGQQADVCHRHLSLLLEQAAITIHRLSTMEHLRERVDSMEIELRTMAQLREANRAIDRQREGLERTLAIHDQLTRMVLDGQSIEVICANLSRLVANPVAVKDRFQTLISVYAVDDTTRIDDGWHEMIRAGGTPMEVASDSAIVDLGARLQRDHRPARLAPLGRFGFDIPRVVAPVVLARQTLAYITVLESQRELDELDLMTVERAAVAVALRMMNEKAETEARYKLLGDLVTEIVEGSYDSDDLVMRRANYLGIDLHQPRAVLIVDVDDFAGFAVRKANEGNLVALKSNLRDLVVRVCTRLAAQSVISTRSDEVIVLARIHADATNAKESSACPCSRTRRGQGTSALRRCPDGQHRHIQDIADAIRAEVRRSLPEITVSVGAGTLCDVPKLYAQSYRQARRALDVIKASGASDRTVLFEQMDISGVLFDPLLVDQLVPVVRRTLGALLDYDGRHKSALVDTLDQYLRHDGHLDAAASALHVHPNTLRYRLERVETVAGVDLHDVETKFNLQLAMKLLRVLDMGNGRRYL